MPVKRLHAEGSRAPHHDRREAARRTAAARAPHRVPGIGPTGAGIFLREVQAVWPDVEPFVDRKGAAGAKKLGLPSSSDGLDDLVDRSDLPRLAPALVRVSLDRKAADKILRAADETR